MLLHRLFTMYDSLTHPFTPRTEHLERGYKLRVG